MTPTSISTPSMLKDKECTTRFYRTYRFQNELFSCPPFWNLDIQTLSMVHSSHSFTLEIGNVLRTMKPTCSSNVLPPPHAAPKLDSFWQLSCAEQRASWKLASSAFHQDNHAHSRSTSSWPSSLCTAPTDIAVCLRGMSCDNHRSCPILEQTPKSTASTSRFLLFGFKDHLLVILLLDSPLSCWPTFLSFFDLKEVKQGHDSFGLVWFCEHLILLAFYEWVLCEHVIVHNHFGWQSSHSVELAGWPAKMASIEIWLPWCNAHKSHLTCQRH